MSFNHRCRVCGIREGKQRSIELCGRLAALASLCRHDKTRIITSKKVGMGSPSSSLHALGTEEHTQHCMLSLAAL
jgi:hypothetical protein